MIGILDAEYEMNLNAADRPQPTRTYAQYFRHDSVSIQGRFSQASYAVHREQPTQEEQSDAAITIQHN
jgi:hypothetical protein